MSMQKDKKMVALVTGASRGIGAAIATKLAQAGFFVIGTATNDAGARLISDYLGTNGAGVQLQLKDSSQLSQFIPDLQNQYGDIGILVNNAGITKDGLFMRMKDEDISDVLQINLEAVMKLTRSIIKTMVKNRYGRIVNISSVVGFTGNPGQANYCATKAAMVGFSKALALEFGTRNITVNCVAPGFIHTDMTVKLPEKLKLDYEKRTALGRFGTVHDIANAVNFLVSENADYITGTTLHVNGGLFMG